MTEDTSLTCVAHLLFIPPCPIPPHTASPCSLPLCHPARTLWAPGTLPPGWIVLRTLSRRSEYWFLSWALRWPGLSLKMGMFFGLRSRCSSRQLSLHSSLLLGSAVISLILSPTEEVIIPPIIAQALAFPYSSPSLVYSSSFENGSSSSGCAVSCWDPDCCPFVNANVWFILLKFNFASWRLNHLNQLPCSVSEMRSHYI